MSRMRHAHRGKLRVLLTVVAAAMAVMAGSARAEEAKKDWEPAPPMPDKFDWVQLVSDEWLKGEIIAMYKESLEFDSDELDDLTLDFGDIKQIRSAGVMQVGLVGGGVATGKLLMDGDEVRVMGEKDQVFEKKQVLSITSGEPRERNYWTAKFGAGINLRGGNSDQVESNARIGIKRRTVKNRIELDYLGNYSTTNDVTAADNQRLSVAWTVSSPIDSSFLRYSRSTIATPSRTSRTGGRSAPAPATRLSTRRGSTGRRVSASPTSRHGSTTWSRVSPLPPPRPPWSSARPTTTS